MANPGFLGINAAVEYGGTGLGMLELVLLQERLADHDTAVFVVNQGIAVPSISRHGTAEQKER